MGKIYKLSDKNGNVLYPMTIGDAIAVDGATLTKKITTEATQKTRGMMSASDKTKLDGIATGATANKGTVTGVTIKAGTGIAVDNQTQITTSGERTISLAPITGLADTNTYKSVNVDKYGRVTSGSNPTTLGGYGITDARIENGKIFLGDSSIAPLTDDSNYVTLDGNQALTHKTYNDYTLDDACAKGVDDAVSSISTNLPTSKAVAAYVDGALVSVLKYQGTVTSTSGLPATHKVGYVYVVAQAGTYAGQSCEVGDYIICKTAGTTANNAHWDVINGENQVSDKNPTLSWGVKSTVATVDGTDIHVTMPSNPAANKADKATTLAGYGIRDASIHDNGEIHLGGKSITPLTRHQDISGKQNKITIKGILKGTGTDVSTAVAGTDYLAPVSKVTNTPTADSSTPTQIICEVTQATSGQITVKKSAFTIAKSVPSNAKFTDTTYPVASTSVNGLMTKDMVTTLNGLEEIKIVTTAVTSTAYDDKTIESIIKGA